jgi:hypothetical protein
VIITQLIYGSLLIVGTVIIQVAFISTLTHSLQHMTSWLSRPPIQIKTITVLSAMVLWLVAGLSVSAALWAWVYLLIGVFNHLEPALYFSIVTFSTLGYGDIVLDAQWRLLGSLTAVNGLIIVGLNTAVLVEAITRIRVAQHGISHN